MSILIQKQRERGVEQINARAKSLMVEAGLDVISVTWDLGQFDHKKKQHTLNILSQNSIAKEQFDNHEIEDCFSFVRPAVDGRLQEMISRLKNINH